MYIIDIIVVGFLTTFCVILLHAFTFHFVRIDSLLPITRTKFLMCVSHTWLILADSDSNSELIQLQESTAAANQVAGE